MIGKPPKQKKLKGLQARNGLCFPCLQMRSTTKNLLETSAHQNIANIQEARRVDNMSKPVLNMYYRQLRKQLLHFYVFLGKPEILRYSQIMFHKFRVLPGLCMFFLLFQFENTPGTTFLLDTRRNAEKKVGFETPSFSCAYFWEIGRASCRERV